MWRTQDFFKGGVLQLDASQQELIDNTFFFLQQKKERWVNFPDTGGGGEGGGSTLVHDRPLWQASVQKNKHIIH